MASSSHIRLFTILLTIYFVLPHNSSCKLNRIVGGQKTKPGEMKSMAAILKEDFQICGGSLLNEHCVLTAAHCFREPNAPYLYRLVLGAYNIKDFPSEALVQTFPVNKIDIHPKYRTYLPEYDLALACTARQIKYTNHVQPALLPVKKWLDFCPEATVYGWGRTMEAGYASDILLKVNVPYVSNKKCNQKYNNTKFIIRESQVCFGANDGDRDSCSGDSGGPLICNTGTNNGTQIGIVSFGIGCGRATYPGVNTRVSYFLKWIKKTKDEYNNSLF